MRKTMFVNVKCGRQRRYTLMTLTSANELGLTIEIITGESPLNLKPYSSANSLFRLFKLFTDSPPPLALLLFVLMLLLLLRLLKSSGRIELLITMSESMLCAVLAFFRHTVLGTVQWRFAENIASGPSFLNGSSTCQKSCIESRTRECGGIVTLHLLCTQWSLGRSTRARISKRL